MPKYLGMSFEGELAPSFDLHCLRPGHRAPDGWGIGYYPGGGPSSAVLKEPAPPHGSIRSALVKAWEHLESSLFLFHIRVAIWGPVSDSNTQPFCRSWGGRDWLFAHGGSLKQRPALREGARFEPIGTTDTELVFCELLDRIAERGWRSLGEADPAVLHSWLVELDAHGTMTSLLTDGQDLLVYADADGDGPVYCWEILPPYTSLAFGDSELQVDLTRRGVKSRKGVIVCSHMLDATGDETASWRTIAPGHLLVVRQGAVRLELGPAAAAPTISVPGPDEDEARRGPAEARRLSVSHRTIYRYAQPVERSTHLLRLVPAHDHLQTLHAHALTITLDGEPLLNGKQREYEDVFGNRARRLLIERPYSELVIEARSSVEPLDVDPFAFRPLRARSTIPLVWMPWQRQVLEPYLLPPELPESELNELVDYAMSFVKRNDSDLLETLLDLNRSIFREYEYRQGATTVFTTPFEVYANRRGVCQDFTNVFICLARLLGVPARYVCGYIYTGSKSGDASVPGSERPRADASTPGSERQRQSEASHAWVQVYLPEVGWKGFDPTNGIVTRNDHVRVAVGRNYVDATPTSGTIYVGGGAETLEVEVRVEVEPGAGS